jgi:hypothetical protein
MKTIISGIISIVFNLVFIVWSISCTYANEVDESSSSIRHTFSIKWYCDCQGQENKHENLKIYFGMGS